MRNKIGVITSTYEGVSLEETLRGISKTGFKYIELVLEPDYFKKEIVSKSGKIIKKNIDKILGLCKENKIKVYCIAGHQYMMKENTINSFKKVMDAAKLFGVNFITTDTGEVNTKCDEKKFYSYIEEIADYAKLKGLTICLEIHGSWCNNGKKGAEIIETINNSNIRLNYDTGNVIFYGNRRPEEDIEYALPYMSFLHLKESGSGKFREWNFPALGKGIIDFRRIFHLIKKYNGPISVEIEFDGKKRVLKEINEAVNESYEFLKNFGYV